jgi:hypothetical protein
MSLASPIGRAWAALDSMLNPERPAAPVRVR